MGWVRSAIGWGLAMVVVGAILGAIQPIDDLPLLLLTMATIGAALGLVFHQSHRAETREDIALEAALLDPESTDQASEWLRQLHAGHRVKIRWAFATFTPEGIEWAGLRKSSVRWQDVESARTWTMSSGGRRSARMVRLRVNGKDLVISCRKRNFDDVLATCSAMMRAATTDGPHQDRFGHND